MPVSKKYASPSADPRKPRGSGKNREVGSNILIFGIGDFHKIGGVQVALKDLTSYLVSKKHNVYLYTNREKIDNQDYLYDFDKKLKINHYTLTDNIECKNYIRNTVLEINPDVVVMCSSGQMCIVALLAMYDMDVPVVISERGGDEHNLQHSWFSREQRAIAHYMSDNTHFLMDSYRKGLPPWMSRQITCIPELTDPSSGRYADPQAPAANGRYRVMYAGRLSFEKDVNILIEAFARLLDRFPDWDLHIYGGGAEEERLRRQVADLAGDRRHVERFVFEGNIDRQRLFDEYCRAHIFVLPSRNEGSPLALREAMARGLPVIGFATASGVNEIIVDGSNGLLADGGNRAKSLEASLAKLITDGAARVRTGGQGIERDGSNGLLAAGGNKVNGLEAALTELMADGAARVRMGGQGIEDVKQYAPDVVLSRWEQLILDTAACKGRRREVRDARYEGVAEVERFAKPIEIMQQSQRVRNLFIFDPTIPLNRLEGVDRIEYALCFGSLLFDPAWYSMEYFEVKRAGLNPLAHYLSEGYRLGYRPSPRFDPEYYGQYHPAAASEAPLAHYYRFGRYAGTLPSANPDAQLLKQLERERLQDASLASLMKAADFPQKVQRAAVNWYDWRRAVLSLVPKEPDSEIAAPPPKEPAQPKPQVEVEAQVIELAAVPAARIPKPSRPPRASIVIPVYNKAEYLKAAVESALHQSYHDVEVIAVDDGSTDQSSEILNAMAQEHRNLTVIRQENLGLSGARNTGIAASTGEYLFFHDADDHMELDAIENLVKVAIDNGSDIVGGVFRRKTDEREFIITAFQENLCNIDFKKNIQKAYQYSTNLSCCDKLFRKTFLVGNKLGFIPGLYMQDIDLWMRVMFLSEKISQTEHVVSTYFQRSGSASSLRTEKRFQSIFDLVDGLMEFYDVNDWRQFTPMRNHALIQGAMYFFVKWKLEEFDGTNISPDLRRLWTLLQRFPTDDLATFYIRKNKGPIAAIFLLARQGEFAAAKAVLERNDTQGHRKLIDMNPNPTPEDIVRHALDLVDWTKIPVSA